ncbi:ABC transporter permease [Streptomyces sp. NPDC015220]|uniref:ABC transporter permease n=1 Tax=Streptomyces sp. NPDC015220 TaxID=3364947 RepID=UPI0036F6C55F
MTTTVTTPATAVTPAPVAGGPRARAVLALALFEARELLQQAVVLLFFVVYTASAAWQMFSGHPGWHELTGREGMADYPALQDADRATQGSAVLLGVALFVCANRAVLRSRRRGTDQHFDTLVMEPWRRTLAHALSVLPFALFTGLVVAVRFGWAALRPGAVGHGSFFELAVAPLTVLLCGVAGVLLARLIPSSFAAPLLAVAAYVAVLDFLVLADDAHWSRWLSPVVTETGADPLPSDLVGRPAAWHALYLTGLTALLLCAALLRAGGRSVRIRVATAVALAATAAGVAGQSPGPSAALQAARTKVSAHPESVESCTVRGATTYCALPEWTGRTADWAKAVDRVRSLARGDAAARPLTVRQRVEARYGLDGDASYDPLGTPGAVTVGTRWGGNRVPEFSAGLAAVLVAGDEEAAGRVCDGRVVTIMWLALGADPDPLRSLRAVRLDDSTEGGAYVLTPTTGLLMSAGQTKVVTELLHRPRAEVTARVRAHWTELTTPGVDTARVARLLSVPATGLGGEAGNSCHE